MTRVALFAVVLLAVAGATQTAAGTCCVSAGVPDLPVSASCVSVAGSGWTEDIVVNQPPAGTDQHAMILMFHGQDHDYCWNNGSTLADKRNELFNAASAAGWWTVTFNGCTTAALCNPSGDNATYGSPEMHEHAQDIIQYMIDTHGIDKHKVYGFGYSMGGDVLNFAARHLDRDGHGAMLAGVWARSAVTSTPMLWECFGGLQGPLENLLGATGDPGQDPFAFIQSSAIFHFENDVCPHGPMLAFDSDRSLAHNLADRYVKLTGPTADPPNIRYSYEMFDDFMVAEGYDNAPFYETDLTLPGSHLTWGGFNATDVVTFLAQQTSVEYPAPPQKTIAVADGTWYWFDVIQDEPRVITPFRWDTNVGQNKVSIKETKNLSSIEFNLGDLGLTGHAAGRDLKVKYRTEDTANPATKIVISDFGRRPKFVRLIEGNQVKYYFGPGIGWTHSGSTLTLLDQGGPNLHNWLVRP